MHICLKLTYKKKKKTVAEKIGGVQLISHVTFLPHSYIVRIFFLILKLLKVTSNPKFCYLQVDDIQKDKENSREWLVHTDPGSNYYTWISKISN